MVLAEWSDGRLRRLRELCAADFDAPAGDGRHAAVDQDHPSRRCGGQYPSAPASWQSFLQRISPVMGSWNGS